MKKRVYIYLMMLGFSLGANAQYFDSTEIANINAARIASEGDFYLDTIRGLQYIGLTTGEVAEVGNSSGWSRSGNDSATTTQFLGTLKDARLSLRSDNLPLFEIGRRETLGLVDNTGGLFPYNVANSGVAYVRGVGGVSALEFEASGASFYKPIFFTDTDGNFKMRGSSANTDFFELGSFGTSNNGGLDFLIGDDGNEPMTFRKYNYSPVSYVEMMRLQGVGLNSTVRAGIATNGVIANSTLQVGGSFATNVRSVSTAGDIGETDYTILLTNNSTLTLPDADTCEGRIYFVKKTSVGTSSISSYQDNLNQAKTQISQGAYQFQSDGSLWQLLSSTAVADSSNQSIASLTYADDTLSITEGDTTFKVEMNVYGTQFHLFESSALSSTTSTTLQTKINQTTSILPVGKYEITISYLWNYDDDRDEFISDFTFGGQSVTSTTGNTIHRQEPKEDNGNQSFGFTKTFYVDVNTAGTRTALLQYRTSDNGDTARIWNVAIKIIRVQ